MPNRTFSLLFLLMLVFASGCAHSQLQKQQNLQTGSISTLYEQQVLDNLAAFAANPGALPSFAIASSGGTTVAHSNTMNGGLTWTPFALMNGTAGLNGTRQINMNWTMTPVSDRARLELMKCIFQYATSQNSEDCCNDCLTQLTKFYDGDLSACNLPQRFYTTHRSKPKFSDNCQEKIGEHCGCYVSVAASKFECLSRVTLAILEIATLSDEAILARTTDAERTVEVTETFIARDKDKNPRLFQGTFTLPAEEYEKIEEASLYDRELGQLYQSIFSGKEAPLKEELPAEMKTFDLDTDQIVPLRPLNRRRAPDARTRAAEIESILQRALPNFP